MPLFTLVVTVRIEGDMCVTFESEPMNEMWADVVLRLFSSRGTFEVVKARKVPVKAET